MSELVDFHAETFDKRLTRVVEALRDAANEVEAIRTTGRTPSEVHPITRGRRAAALASAVHRSVDNAVRDADLSYLHKVASDLDLAHFPQTQEM